MNRNKIMPRKIGIGANSETLAQHMINHRWGSINPSMVSGIHIKGLKLETRSLGQWGQMALNQKVIEGIILPGLRFLIEMWARRIIGGVCNR